MKWYGMNLNNNAPHFNNKQVKNINLLTGLQFYLLKPTQKCLVELNLMEMNKIIKKMLFRWSATKKNLKT